MNFLRHKNPQSLDRCQVDNQSPLYKEPTFHSSSPNSNHDSAFQVAHIINYYTKWSQCIPRINLCKIGASIEIVSLGHFIESMKTKEQTLWDNSQYAARYVLIIPSSKQRGEITFSYCILLMQREFACYLNIYGATNGVHVEIFKINKCYKSINVLYFY